MKTITIILSLTFFNFIFAQDIDLNQLTNEKGWCMSMYDTYNYDPENPQKGHSYKDIVFFKFIYHLDGKLTSISQENLDSETNDILETSWKLDGEILTTFFESGEDQTQIIELNEKYLTTKYPNGTEFTLYRCKSHNQPKEFRRK